MPEAIEAAQFYLAGYLGINQRQIELLSWEEAIWLSSGLGCLPSEVPATRSPVKGYRALFTTGGQIYEVHTDATGQNMCVSIALQPGERVSIHVRVGQEPDEAARSHLAGRLGINLNEVMVVDVQPGEWEDEYLGCPPPAVKLPDRASPRIIIGEQILLSAQDITHEYHTSGLWLVYCGEAK